MASLDDQAALTKAFAERIGRLSPGAAELWCNGMAGRATAAGRPNRRGREGDQDCACGPAVFYWRPPSGRHGADSRRSLWRTSAHGRGAQRHDLAARLLYGELGQWYRNGQAEGLLPSFIPPKMSMPMISTRDIGRGSGAIDCRRRGPCDCGTSGSRGSNPEGWPLSLAGFSDEASPYRQRR